MESNHVDRLAALAHPQRLALFRLLMRRYPDTVPAGELAGALGVKQSTLSTYLNVLRRSGLIVQARNGRSLLYRAEMEIAGALVGYLFSDCCRGRPPLCPAEAEPQGAAHSPGPARKMNVLFLCSGNSARSLMAEAIIRHEAGQRFEAHSAGTQPVSHPDPEAIRLLRQTGHDITTLRPKGVAAFHHPDAAAMDFVFTVCNRAANEDLPALPGRPFSAHWGVPDPVQAPGTDVERQQAFRDTYAAIHDRIAAFAALDLAALDRAQLQQHLDSIGHTQEQQ